MSASELGFFNLLILDANGSPAVGGRVYTYTQGTTIQKDAYTDAAAAVVHTYTSDGVGGQYIALNARGELPAPLFGTSGAYDIHLKTSAGATVWTRRADPMQSVSDITASTGSAIVGHISSGAGAVATTAQVKLRHTVHAIDYGAIGDGSDEKAELQAALDYLVTQDGGTLLLDPSKTYKVGSALTIGTTVTGVKVCIDGQGGATIEALTAFTGGVLIVGSASEVVNLWGTGAGYTTAGHCFIYCGTATYTNVSPHISNVRSNGGFYDFVSSDYELDLAYIEVTSFFAVGRAVVYSGTNAYAPSSGLTIIVNARGDTTTPVVGSPRTTCVYVAMAEDSRIKINASYFDAMYFLGSSCRNVKVDESLVLEFRGAYFATKWAALTAYTEGQFRAPTLALTNGYFYLCTTAGTSGAAEPTWPVTYNGTVADGTVVWTEIGSSIAGWHSNAKQTLIQSSRFEDFNVCLRGLADHTTSVRDSRLVGDCSYIAYTNSTSSALVAVNNTLAGDLRINSTIPASSGKTQFSGAHNSITGDTAAVVPNHAQSVYSSQPYQTIGIKFPATAVASSDGNTLDDYEEGTWTGIYVSDGNVTGTPTFSNGTYVKIGRLATLFGQWTADITATGAETFIQFEGIPFTQRANASQAVGTASLAGNTYAAGTVIDASAGAATRFIVGFSVAATTVNGSRVITFSITYEAA